MLKIDSKFSRYATSGRNNPPRLGDGDEDDGLVVIGRDVCATVAARYGVEGTVALIGTT